jgi:putative Mg2+ transporter-C (MgtC) family protein
MDSWRWLFSDVRAVLPFPLAEVAILLASAISGALIGAERERLEKPAGLRTMMLISLGTTIFTLASMTPALGYRDPGRIAAQIVTGIGFLGAGSIVRERGSVTGLTTAATIWASAGIGVIAGAGFALAAVALCGAVLSILLLVRRIESLFGGACRMVSMTIVYQPARGKTRARVQNVLDDYKQARLDGDLAVGPDGGSRLRITFCDSHKEHRAVLGSLAELPDVIGFEGETAAGSSRPPPRS